MVVLVLGVGQLVLPGIAAQVIRDRLAGRATGAHVSVAAVPAVELLFGDADRVTISMRSYRAGPPKLASDLSDAAGVSDLRVSVGTLDAGLLSLRHVTLTKHGASLVGTAELTDAELRQRIPFLASVTPLGSADGTITLQGTTTDLPLVGQVTADVNVGAQDGRVVVAAGGLLGSVLPTLTVWSDPRVAVTGLSGRPVADGLAVTATGRLN